jgi:Lrp/AsnC family leucine-responsive transcriptional regulator
MSNKENFLDRTDRAILDCLQKNSRLTLSEISELVSLSPTPCWRRIKRLEEDGVIEGYHARLNRAKLGFTVTVFVSVMLEHHSSKTSQEFENAILEIDEVVSCYNISGRDDFFLVMVAKGIDEYSKVLLDKIRSIANVKEIHSSFVLRASKESTSLPVF